MLTASCCASMMRGRVRCLRGLALRDARAMGKARPSTFGDADARQGDNQS